MSFDKPTRNLLAKTVAACRDRLAVDITDQLQSTYGLYPDSTALDVARTEDERRAAEDLRDLLAHFEAAEAGTDQECKAAAYQRLVREIGFTLLNRLAALRLAEERELVIECVRRGMASVGFQLFDQLINGALGNRYQTYRAFLENIFDELALDLGVLFDRSAPQSHVFPGEAALTAVLALLNDSELTAHNLWQQDETIGWIYQYYNDPAERKAMRDASQAPRNSRELAVRNQFFTPRYVVEFLTDNTLGRTWYEMHQGDTRLVDECRYLVRRPNEIFLAPDQTPPSEDTNSPDIDIQSPTYIPRRPKKDPRDLKILDPACGSGHFLLYSFDLLSTIYEEAWADLGSPPFTENGTTLAADYTDVDELRRAIPGLILRHNLHGIDIDPRAVQIAALALWLRAQRAYQDLDLPNAERPRITKTNIVTAEPMPGDEELLAEFVAGLESPLIGDLVRVVFEKMKLVGEAGPLLKIEEELKEAISEARRQWAAQPEAEQLTLWPEARRPQPEQLPLFDLSGITDEAFWETVETRTLEALRDYATRVENGKGTRRRLFAEDSAQGFAFVDLCQQRFDVVLMNPPFGLVPQDVFDYLQKSYPDTYVDVYSAFVVRGSLLTHPGGCTGAITSRSFMMSKKLERWRKNQLLASLDTIVDLGRGVMDDALIDSAVYVVRNLQASSPYLLVFDLRRQPEPAACLQDIVASPAGSPFVYTSARADLRELPGSKLLYFLAGDLNNLVRDSIRFEPKIGTARKGLTTFDDFRFLRLCWEVSNSIIGQKWERFAKGGEYSNYYTNVHLCVNRGDEGVELAEVNRRVNGQVAQSRQGSSYYYRAGCQYTGRSAKGFSARAIPAGCVMSSNSPMILSESDISNAFILGWVNSRLIRSIIQMQAMADDFVPGIVKNLPWVPPDEATREIIEERSLELITIYRDFACNDEIEPVFSGHRMNGGQSFMLTEWVEERNKDFEAAKRSITSNQTDISHALDRLYQLDSTDIGEDVLRKDIASEITLEVLDKQEWVTRMLSWIIGLVFGRWEFRLALSPALMPKLQNPFDPLPVCPPGMLVRPDGLPATSGNIVSEAWMNARPNAITLPAKGSFDGPATILDKDYPLHIAWEGILVDDPGIGGQPEPHPSDIVRRAREVMAVLWQENHDAIEAEACEILGMRELRDYFRKPAGFFADHLKRYSKSRRKAPIYWPLSTISGSYTLWLYYHRLDDQILYTAVNRYVGPKIGRVERHVTRLEADLAETSGAAASRLRDRLDDVRAFLTELREFQDELLRIAGLPYKPNLNDGVIINAAPLHKLFRLRKWANDTEKIWQKLEAGDYDWAHMAYTLWPDRVREVCKRDRSIAIAHGLEALSDFSSPRRWYNG